MDAEKKPKLLVALESTALCLWLGSIIFLYPGQKDVSSNVPPDVPNAANSNVIGREWDDLGQYFRGIAGYDPQFAEEFYTPERFESLQNTFQQVNDSILTVAAQSDCLPLKEAYEILTLGKTDGEYAVPVFKHQVDLLDMLAKEGDDWSELSEQASPDDVICADWAQGTDDIFNDERSPSRDGLTPI